MNGFGANIDVLFREHDGDITMCSMIEEVVAHVSNNLIDLYTRGVVA